MTVAANDSSVWRAFENAELTHSSAHYLMAVMHVRKRQGYARATDVAEYLGVTRGAASKAMQLLKERGWIIEDVHRMLDLSEEGSRLARMVERNFLVIECFLEDILGVPSKAAREDACKMEHLLSPCTMRALLKLVQFLAQDEQHLRQLKEELATFRPQCDPADPCLPCVRYDGCIGAETEAFLETLKE
ncbi:metal-dependent transcriptional regulator [bacterium]|nr:metal-dependent transcriptional regulator [bacterium]